jgi:Raf kinase inhibitor-like YbhB/YbcL family protein
MKRFCEDYMLARFLSHLLRGVHAGETHLAWNELASARAPASITLTTDAFPAGGLIPVRYAGRGVGDNISPGLRWSPPPAGTAEWVLIMQDPDAPLPRPFVHLIAYGISAETTELEEGALSTPSGRVRVGRNTFGGSAYMGARALPGHGLHRYVFQLFALDRGLSFTKPPRLRPLLRAMQGSVIARARLDAFFERKSAKPK